MQLFKSCLILSTFLFLSACSSEAVRLSVSSADDAWQLSTSGAPEVLTISAANTAKTFRQYNVINDDSLPTTITCLFEAPSRRSFLAVLNNTGEIWEMSYDPEADPVFPGFVHNYRTGQVEGITVEEQPFARRRLHLKLDHRNLIFSPSHTEVIGYDAKGGVVVYNLDSRKTAGKLTNQSDVSLSKSWFTQLNGELVFILSFTDNKQLVFSAHSWREIELKAQLPGEPIPVEMCIEKLAI